MAKYRLSTLLAALAVVFILVAQLAAGVSPVVTVEGVEGDVFGNVVNALAFPEGLVEDGRLEPILFRRFAEQAEGRVKTALEPFGYYHPVVNVRSGEKAPGEFFLHVKVVPGEPVRLADVSVVIRGPGKEEPSLRELVAAFPLVKGGILLHEEYEAAREKLFSRCQEMGYLDATFPVHEIRVDQEALTAGIRLEMETGPRYYFGETKIEGAADYPDAFLRRYLTFEKGDLFSYEKIGETQLNFINSERFQNVDVIPQKGEAVGDIPVLVSLKPGRSRSLRQGIGYGTDTGGRFSMRYRDLNMFHRGHELQSNLYVSEFLQGMATGYTMPNERDINSFRSFQLNLQREDVSTYKTSFVAFELAETRSLAKKLIATGYVKFQYERYTIGLKDSDARLAMPGVRLSGSFYDSPSHPRKGFNAAFELRGTEKVLGSNMGILQIIAEGGAILPLPGRLLLHARGKAGSSLLSDPLGDLPPSLRFFAGGDQSVRGYAYQSLGPRDESGLVVGGKQLLFGSLELEREIGEDWGASIFYDTGNSFDYFADIRMAQGAGIGIQYYTPVGKLNFSVARQLGVDDPGTRIHFAVGIGF